MNDKILEKILNKLDKLDSLDEKVSSIDEKVSSIDEKVSSLEKQLDTVAIEVVGIKEQLKDTATKDDLVQIKNDILGEVDSFVKLHETLDQESSALKNSHSRLEERVSVVEKKLQTA